MTPDQMASEELTQWRVSTMRKELEMIKEVAEEEMQLSSSKTIRKMTYKGEVEIEQPTAVQVCVCVCVCVCVLCGYMTVCTRCSISSG